MNDHLNWRYATKKFDPTKKISQQELAGLLDVLRLAPSSYGLQPWQFIVVKDDVLRKELKQYAWNQPQITDASNLLVFCAVKNLDEGYVRNFATRIAETRGVTRESISAYEQMMLGHVKARTSEELLNWSKLQVYLTLGFFLAECANRKIDACPMEGFDPKKFDEVLGLAKIGLASTVLCTIGYRAEDDKYAQLKKVRFDKSAVFIER